MALQILPILIVLIILKYLFDDHNIKKIDRYLDRAINWFSDESDDSDNEDIKEGDLASLGNRDIDFSRLSATKIAASASKSLPDSAMEEIRRTSAEELAQQINSHLRSYSFLKPYAVETMTASKQVANALKFGNAV